MIQENGIWYMFFEVKEKSGDTDIAVAESRMGLNWSYDQIVLENPQNNSFPHVFKWENDFYMTPSRTYSVPLYRAENFPYEWRHVENILQDENKQRRFVDPVIFRKDNLWYLFVGKGRTNDVLWLYYSENLTNPDSWIEHPESPVIQDNANVARPGGDIIKLHLPPLLQ